ncbi:hypothetical protein SP15_185 [Bacillus phage SP-15]|uniref:Uncharacterized protein n=1 Tax=Bacillus phage SP-15 TaxID=1792032 RepID=A0A127AWG6_9CAUD|nr:hypothetical protein SP15_185 [Bacillus phage SP-15]AMM44985.1 hypothetical protein SP15_185 [Bacillus phage SP-15]
MPELQIAESHGLQDVLVFQLCDCDSVAAYTLDEAIDWYKNLTGLTDDELYPYDEIETVPFDYQVRISESDSTLTTVRQIVDQLWDGTPFIVTSKGV